MSFRGPWRGNFGPVDYFPSEAQAFYTCHDVVWFYYLPSLFGRLLGVSLGSACNTRPDLDLGFMVKVLTTFEVARSSLGGGPHPGIRSHHPLVWMRSHQPLEPFSTVYCEPFTKSHVASRNQPKGLMRCKFGHVPRRF